MKYLLALLLLSPLAIAAPSPNVASITLAWNYDFVASPGVTNFIIYSGTSSSNYTSSVSANGTNLTLVINGLNRGSTYYFAATAVNTNGLESDYSNELQVRIPNKPAKPSNLINQ